MKEQTIISAEPIGFELTLKILAESASARASDTLISALGEASPYTQEHIFDVLFARTWDAVARKMILAYHRLAPNIRAKILDRVDDIVPYIKQVLENGSSEGKGNALSIISDSRRVALLPSAAALLRSIDERYRDRTVEIVMESAARLLSLIKNHRIGDFDKLPRGLKKSVRIMLDVLAESLRMYPVHRKTAVFGTLLNYGIKGREMLIAGFPKEHNKTAAALTEILLNNTAPATDAFIALMLYSDTSYIYKKGEYLFRQRKAASSGRIVCSALKHADAGDVTQLELNYGRKPWWRSVLQHIKYLDEAAQNKLVEHLEKKLVPAVEAGNLLKALLDSPRPDVRRRALAAMENKGERDDANVNLLSDPDERIQQRATIEVVKSNVENREELLVRQVLSEFSSVREIAAREVANFSFHSYFQAFDKLDEKTRKRAAGAIAKIDKRLTEKLQDALTRKSEKTCIKTLNMITLTGNGQQFGGEIIEMVNSTSPAVRIAAVTALGTVNSPGARATAQACLTDADRRVLAGAIRCLAQMRYADVREEVMKHRTHLGSYVRASVLYYLHEMDDPAFGEELNRMLNDPVEKYRISAAMTIETLRPPNSVEMLQGLARRDQVPAVRDAARKALQKMGEPLDEKSDTPEKEAR